MDCKDAERFRREELGLPKTTFNCIHWDGLNKALNAKGTPSAYGCLSRSMVVAGTKTWCHAVTKQETVSV